jgi:hypothetical protein
MPLDPRSSHALQAAGIVAAMAAIAALVIFASVAWAQDPADATRVRTAVDRADLIAILRTRN